MRGLTILFGRASGADSQSAAPALMPAPVGRTKTGVEMSLDPAGRSACATVAIMCLLLATATAAVVDRIAVAVDNRAIKESQIDRDLRLTAFLNGTPLDAGIVSTRKAADRLIDQT